MYKVHIWAICRRKAKKGEVTKFFNVHEGDGENEGDWEDGRNFWNPTFSKIFGTQLFQKVCLKKFA